MRPLQAVSQHRLLHEAETLLQHIPFVWMSYGVAAAAEQQKAAE